MKINTPYLFTKGEIIDKFKDEKQFENWIFCKTKSKKIKRVRNGLYILLDSLGNTFLSKFEIASKVNSSCYISYHSALEYYGLANQVFNDVIVSSDSRFNSFVFNDVEYICNINKNLIQIENRTGTNIKVTSYERTIIDCIDNIDLAGGIEEVVYALEKVNSLDIKKLLEVLQSYNKIFLYQKVGFILEQYKERISIDSAFFNECEKKITMQVKYFLNRDYNHIEYNSKWKLMSPKDIRSIIHGGI